MDSTAKNVDMTSITTTIEALRNEERPSSVPRDTRVSGSAEMQTFTVEAMLTKYIKESDMDYHLVLTAPNGDTIIAEVVDPECLDESSPFFKDIVTTSDRWRAHYNINSEPRGSGSAPDSDRDDDDDDDDDEERREKAAEAFAVDLNDPVRVTGVGFFDYLHGQTGVAPNGFELHPILSIEWTGPRVPTPQAPTLSPGTCCYYNDVDCRNGQVCCSGSGNSYATESTCKQYSKDRCVWDPLNSVCLVGVTSPTPAPPPTPFPAPGDCCFYNDDKCYPGQTCCTGSGQSYVSESTCKQYGERHGCVWTGNTCLIPDILTQALE